MKVTIACDFPHNERLGSAKVPIREAEALRALGVNVHTIFSEDLARGGRGKAQLLTAPARMAAALRRCARDSDVVDVAGFDAWLYHRAARAMRSRQALVTRSNGLWYRVVEVQRRFESRGLVSALASDLFQRQVLCRWERDSLVQCDLARTMSGTDREQIVVNGWKKPDEVVAINLAPDGVFVPTVPLDARAGVISLGSWIRTKGVDSLGLAVDRLLTKHPSLTFVAAGTGASEEQVLASFSPAVRSRVQVVPRASPEEMGRIAGLAAIMVFPTLYEGFGLVTVEAMRAGLAVVTTPTGAGADLIRDGYNGIFVPPEDPQAIEIAVERLLADSDLRIRLARQALADAGRRDWSDVARQLVTSYEAAIRLASERARR